MAPAIKSRYGCSGCCTKAWLYASFACAILDHHVVNLGVDAELRLVSLGGLLDKAVVELVLHQINSAAAEAAAHNARTRHAALLGHVVQKIELGATHLVQLAQTMVGAVHQPTDSLIVVLLHRRAGVQQALDLLDDELGAHVIHRVNLALHLRKHRHIGIAQKFHLRVAFGDGGDDPFARQAAFVILATRQVVRHAGVDQHQTVTLGVERHIFELERTAVEAHQMPLLAAARGELVHDAAHHTHVIVLGRLSDQRDLETLQSQVEQIVEREAEAALQSGRRRHSGAEGHIAREDGVETTHLFATFGHLPAHAEYVARPLLRGLVDLLEAELRRLAQIQSEGAHPVGAVEADLAVHRLVDGSRQNETAVIVGVFADQVDATGRGVDRTRRAVKRFEFFSDFRGIHTFMFLTVNSEMRRRSAGNRLFVACRIDTQLQLRKPVGTLANQNFQRARFDPPGAVVRGQRG